MIQEPGKKPSSELIELLSLPFLMASLSLAMWCSMPSSVEIVNSYGDQLDARRAAIFRLADTIVAREPIRSTTCKVKPVPSPLFVDDASGLWSKHADRTERPANTEFMAEGELREVGWPKALGLDLELHLGGELSTLLRWQREQVGAPGRKSRKRLGGEIERVLRANYVVLYRTRQLVPVQQGPDGGALGSARVEAFLFDLNREDLLCEVGFVEDIDPAFQAEEFERFAHSQLYTQARSRLFRELALATGGEFKDRE